MKLSFAITVCKEITEIQRLVSLLLEHKDLEDEIVILFDSKNGSPKVEEYLRSHSVNNSFRWFPFPFEGNFSDMKNKLTKSCCGDYIINLDADEMVNPLFIKHIKTVIETNPIDLISVPRINTIKGITKEHIDKWGWRVSKLESHIEEKEFNLSNLRDLEEYNLLKIYDLIIREG